MSDWTWFTYGAWTVAVVVGAILSFHGFVSWRRTRSRPMLLLASGVLLLSVAAAAAWIVGYNLTDDVEFPSMLSAMFSAAGFVVLLYSVRTRSA